MSEFPSLAEVLDRHHWLSGQSACACGWGYGDMSEDLNHITHQTDAWRETCTIRTGEELARLPFTAVVRSILRLAPSGRDYGPVWEQWAGGRWFRMGYGPLRGETYEGPVLLPALLIWHPDWERL